MGVIRYLLVQVSKKSGNAPRSAAIIVNGYSPASVRLTFGTSVKRHCQ